MSDQNIKTIISMLDELSNKLDKISISDIPKIMDEILELSQILDKLKRGKS
jgi:hypothetical protein